MSHEVWYLCDMAKTPTRSATKKRAPAPLTEQGKMILRTARRQLAIEQEALAKRQREETINKVRAEYTPANLDQTYLRRNVVDPEELAFQKVVIPRTTAVLSSEGVRATVNVKMNSSHTSGWTDFQNINVTLIRGIEKDARNAAAVLRGILYHEGGHIRFTVPSYVMVNRYNEAIKNDPTRQRMTGNDLSKYHSAWNLAEDQRMEMMVIDDSPNKALYFVPMVLDVVLGQQRALDRLRAMKEAGDVVTDEQIENAQTHVASHYPYVLWRRYMNKSFRRHLRNLYIARHGYEATRELEKAMTAYVRSTNVMQAVDAVIAVHTALTKGNVSITIDNHSGMDGYVDMPEGRQQEAWPTFEDDSDGDDDPEDEIENDDDPEDEIENDDTLRDILDGLNDLLEEEDDKSWVPPSNIDSDIEGDEEDDDDENSPPEGGNNDTPPTVPDNEDVERDDTGQSDDSFDGDDIERMLNEAVAERNADPILNTDEREYNATMSSGVPGSQLLPLHSSAETDTMITSAAYTLAERLEEAFHSVTVEASPTWREQQTRGVVNVGRYLTRQPGDREFFRDFDGGEGEKPGYNMAVSILLDYSGSMNGSMGELAAVAYANKKACDNLEIPCTVVMWDSGARLLWDGNEAVECVPVINSAGSTDPTVALMDICNHRYERENHIVLIMTDGGFSTSNGYLNNFRAPGTYFLGAYYKHGETATNNEMQGLSSKGFDIVHCVKELGDLVGLMETALCESVKVPAS